jgi:toxin ParE1/3/4
MAEIIWTQPALDDLDALADYMALDKPAAASGLVRRVSGRYARREAL